MNHHNPYVRIQTYYSWLINDKHNTNIDDEYDLGTTIKRLHDITDIPIAVIRLDFLCMFQWQNSIATKHPSAEWDTILSFDQNNDNYANINKQYNLDDLFEQLMMNKIFPEKFQQLLLDGFLDDVPIYIDHNATTYQLTLSQEESAALLEYVTRNYPDDKDSGTKSISESQSLSDSVVLHLQIKKMKDIYSNFYNIETKDSYLFTRQYFNLNQRLDMINQAINEQKSLLIRYSPSNGRTVSLHLQPLRITYDADENLYAILSIYNGSIQVHRLDRILSIEKSTKKQEPPNTELLNIYPNVWGNCFSDTPEHVKVKFYNEANVWKKVKKDLANRTNGNLYEKDGFLFYEDIVYGISKFRSWIYGYGSSAIVLEPESLRQHIIESLKARIAQD